MWILRMLVLTGELAGTKHYVSDGSLFQAVSDLQDQTDELGVHDYEEPRVQLVARNSESGRMYMFWGRDDSPACSGIRNVWMWIDQIAAEIAGGANAS